MRLISLNRHLFNTMSRTSRLRVHKRSMTIIHRLVLSRVRHALPRHTAQRVRRRRQSRKTFTHLSRNRRFRHFIRHTRATETRGRHVDLFSRRRLTNGRRIRKRRVNHTLRHQINVLLRKRNSVRARTILPANTFVNNNRSPATNANSRRRIQTYGHDTRFTNRTMRQVFGQHTHQTRGHSFTASLRLFRRAGNILRFTRNLRNSLNIPTIIVFLNRT